MKQNSDPVKEALVELVLKVGHGNIGGIVALKSLLTTFVITETLLDCIIFLDASNIRGGMVHCMYKYACDSNAADFLGLILVVVTGVIDAKEFREDLDKKMHGKKRMVFDFNVKEKIKELDKATAKLYAATIADIKDQEDGE